MFHELLCMSTYVDNTINLHNPRITGYLNTDNLGLRYAGLDESKIIVSGGGLASANGVYHLVSEYPGLSRTYENDAGILIINDGGNASIVDNASGHNVYSTEAWPNAAWVVPDYPEYEPPPVVAFAAPPAVKTIVKADTDNWDEAYSWGDHAEEGYITEIPSEVISGAAAGATAVQEIPSEVISGAAAGATAVQPAALVTPYKAFTAWLSADYLGVVTITESSGNAPYTVVEGARTITISGANGQFIQTAGVYRICLSILMMGAHTITFDTTNVDYPVAPVVPSSGWITILYRKISDGRFIGRQI